MKATTVLLPPELRARSVRCARERGISLGELVRRCLASAIDEAERAPARDPLFADEAVYKGSTPTDVARNHDRYLYGEEA